MDIRATGSEDNTLGKCMVESSQIYLSNLVYIGYTVNETSIIFKQKSTVIFCLLKWRPKLNFGTDFPEERERDRERDNSCP